MTRMVETIFITNNEREAKICDMAGVDWVMVDLESLGKAERQHGRDTLISGHTINDVAVIKNVLKVAKLLVRVNAFGNHSAQEINAVLSAGADLIMFPMVKSVEEITAFRDLVSGRASTVLLLETCAALIRIEHLLESADVDAVHIGLNDLAIEAGLDFMFEFLASNLSDWLASTLRERGISYGFGGVGPQNTGLLDPVLIVRRHARLRSERVILSRAYRKLFIEPEDQIVIDKFSSEIAAIQRAYHAEVHDLALADRVFDKSFRTAVYNAIERAKNVR